MQYGIQQSVKSSTMSVVVKNALRLRNTCTESHRRTSHNEKKTLILLSHFSGSSRSSLQFYKYFVGGRLQLSCERSPGRFTFWLQLISFHRGFRGIFAVFCVSLRLELRKWESGIIVVW